MKRVASLLVLSVFLSIHMVGQSSKFNIESHPMDGVDFKQYETYTWLPFIDEVNSDQYDAQQLDKVATEVIEKELATLGFVKVADNPDVHFQYTMVVDTKKETQQKAVYGAPKLGVGMGFGRGGPSFSVGSSGRKVVGSTTETVVYKEGALIIGMIDVSSNLMVWKGSADRVRKDDGSLVNAEAVIKEVVPKIFKKFPKRK